MTLQTRFMDFRFEGWKKRVEPQAPEHEASVSIEYPLSERYKACRDYISSLDWDAYRDAVRANGVAQFDVTDTAALFPHLSLDENYRLTCYLAHEYHGLWGRIAAVKIGEDDTAAAVKEPPPLSRFGPRLEIPDAAAPPLEAVYHDGAPEGYVEAVICSQFLSAIPYASYEQDAWTELIDARPEDFSENWTELLYIPSWRIRFYPANGASRQGRIVAFSRDFENGLGGSSGIDSIYAASYHFVDDLDLYHMSRDLRGKSSMYQGSLPGRGRYDARHKCCVFGSSGIEVARQKDWIGSL